SVVDPPPADPGSDAGPFSLDPVPGWFPSGSSPGRSTSADDVPAASRGPDVTALAGELGAAERDTAEAGRICNAPPSPSAAARAVLFRSEERRVGKEGR